MPNLTKRELFAVAVTGIGAFVVYNILYILYILYKAVFGLVSTFPMEISIGTYKYMMAHDVATMSAYLTVYGVLFGLFSVVSLMTVAIRNYFQGEYEKRLPMFTNRELVFAAAIGVGIIAALFWCEVMILVHKVLVGLISTIEMHFSIVGHSVTMNHAVAVAVVNMFIFGCMMSLVVFIAALRAVREWWAVLVRPMIIGSGSEYMYPQDTHKR